METRSKGSICVFCGSSPGARPEYSHASEKLGSILALNGIRLIFGGATVGLMGRLADTVMQEGGTVIGIVPRTIADKGIGHTGITGLRVVETLHERKALMMDLSDACIAMPGGLGTTEEFIEALTWAQLGLHAKPCGLLNVCGYFDGLLSFLDHTVSERFLKFIHREMILVDDDPKRLIDRLEAHQIPVCEKWLDRM